jgi:hypothetical protein
MKKFLSLLLGGMLAVSCNQDVCKDVVCGDNGTCDEGLCICDAGYEQDADGLCNVKWSTKFVGTNVAVADTCYGDNGAFSANYNMTITNDTTATMLSTTNLGGFGATNVVDMVATSSTTVSINDTDVAQRLFTGTGTISGSTLSLNYVVTYSDNTKDTCDAVITLP